MFLCVGGFFIISNENIKLNNSENVGLFFEKYSCWMDKLFSNGGVVVGYVSKMEWLPENNLTG